MVGPADSVIRWGDLWRIEDEDEDEDYEDVEENWRWLTQK